MDFDFSDDQKMLADQVGRFLSTQCDPNVVRSVLDKPQRMAQPVWQGLADMGLVGTAIPESYGGTGAGYLELCLVAQELGRHLAPVPFASSVYLVTEALLMFADESTKQTLLPKIASGEVKAAFAITEGLQQNPIQDLKTTITDQTINGEKLVVADGNVADLFLVAARNGLALVEKSELVNVTSVDSVDLSRDTATVVFNNAKATVLTLDTKSAVEQMYNRAAVLFAFEQLGGAQAALDMAVAYAQERFAFGRAIGSFQAIKHMLADMYVAMKLAENNCYYAAWALENNAVDLPLAAATARVAATNAFQLCAKDNIQVHGGMGFTWEFDCHLFYRRSNFLSLVIGGLGEWEAKLVDNLSLQEAS